MEPCLCCHNFTRDYTAIHATTKTSRKTDNKSKTTQRTHTHKEEEEEEEEDVNTHTTPPSPHPKNKNKNKKHLSTKKSDLSVLSSSLPLIPAFKRFDAPLFALPQTLLQTLSQSYLSRGLTSARHKQNENFLNYGRAVTYLYLPPPPNPPLSPYLSYLLPFSRISL